MSEEVALAECIMQSADSQTKCGTASTDARNGLADQRQQEGVNDVLLARRACRPLTPK